MWIGDEINERYGNLTVTLPDRPKSVGAPTVSYLSQKEILCLMNINPEEARNVQLASEWPMYIKKIRLILTTCETNWE